MKNAQVTIAFLNHVSPETKNMILENIASHYGCTKSEAYDEITDEEAESVMDYVTGAIRPAVSLFFNKFKSA